MFELGYEDVDLDDICSARHCHVSSFSLHRRRRLGQCRNDQDVRRDATEAPQPCSWISGRGLLLSSNQTDGYDRGARHGPTAPDWDSPVPMAVWRTLLWPRNQWLTSEPVWNGACSSMSVTKCLICKAVPMRSH